MSCFIDILVIFNGAVANIGSVLVDVNTATIARISRIAGDGAVGNRDRAILIHIQTAAIDESIRFFNFFSLSHLHLSNLHLMFANHL